MSTKKKRSAAAIGRQNRQKGRKAEQAVVDFLKEAGYLKARRWPSNMPAPVTGQKPPDLIVPELPWLAAEVKHAEDMTPWKLMNQAETQCTVGQFPVGFMRKDSRAGPGQPSDRPMMVVMKPVDWLALVKLADECKFLHEEAARDEDAGIALEVNARVARELLKELRELAGPTRDRGDIRKDLVELFWSESGLADLELHRLAKDLGLAPLNEGKD